MTTIAKILTSMALWCCLLGQASAEQGCSNGFIPNASGQGLPCIPIPNYGGPQSAPQAEPEPIWETRWGAIAVATRKKDGVSELGEGIEGLGIARHMPSESLAQRHAMQDCQLHGDGCQLKLTYQDQCGVVVWGVTRAAFASGPTLEAAEKVAMDSCVESSEDCKTYYYDCSYPARVQ